MNEDFMAWVAEAVRAGEPHLLSPGNHVHFAAARRPVKLTAEQAVFLAGYVLACAGVPPDAAPGLPAPDAVAGRAAP